jgi:signal transduction histidine kinase
MYFGGILGFNVFHPDSIKDNPHVPSVVLTDIKVLNRSISPTVDKNRVTRNIPLAEEIRLDYSDNVVTFGFAALEFTNPEENLYAYRLEGFDEDWVLAGTKREATYTNLDPGTYTFRVKASNNDGVWNEQGTAVAIFIAPPWWMSWWFRTILIVLFLSTGPIIYVRRVAALKKQYAIQQEFSRKLIEAQELERKRIATELHDSIGQDLLVIKNRTYMANQVKQLPAKAKTQMNHIMETVTQSLHSVRQVSRNLRPYHLDRVGLTGALRAMLEAVAESSHITFDVRIDTVDGLLKGEKEIEVNFYRIIQESVNNILKHSQATSASIHVTTSERSIHLLMTDNGKGFDVSSVHANGSKAGLGLSGIAERVRILGGVYSIESRLGKGTRISITIPFGDKKGEK